MLIHERISALMIFHPPHRYQSPKWQAPIILDNLKFHFKQGPTVSNLFQLKNALTVVSDSTLYFHVNNDKHDIADWIEHVVGDQALANSLKKQTHRWGLLVHLERQMMRTLNLPFYVAKRWLGPASSELKLISKESATNLKDLSKVLKKTSDETIDFHLERVPNDISQWVLHSTGDYLLSDILVESSNRSQMQRFVSDHISMLKDASKEY